MIESQEKTSQLVKILEGELIERKQKFEEFLPANSNCNFERFAGIINTAVLQNRDLLTAERSSLIAACLKAAHDGLLPDGSESALVIYNTKQKDGRYKQLVQYLPMVRGIIKKIRNTGQLKHISANVVYEFDKFRYTLGDCESLDHEPAIGERGKKIAVYAIVQLKDGTFYRDVMSFAEIETARNKSKAANGSAWSDFWGEMARKTVIKRLSKFLPMSAELEAVLSRDDEMYEFDNGNSFNRNKSSVIDQINAQLENKSDEEFLPPAAEITQIEMPTIDEPNKPTIIHATIPPVIDETKVVLTLSDPINELPFISRGELNRYIAGAKAGKCTWKELGEKYQMTKDDRLHALGQGAAILIEPGSI